MMGESERTAVVPDIDEDGRWFWEAISAGRLRVPRCDDCGRLFFPPMPSCPLCGGTRLSKIEVSGRGSVYSWVTVHAALDPAFADEVPYTVVTVELEEDSGARLLGRLLRNPAITSLAGASVRFSPYRVTPDVALPGFELIDDDDEGSFD